MSFASDLLPPFQVPVPQGESGNIPLKPPFYFSDVTSLIFPLRAHIEALQRFCDNYLNIIPQELGYFRVHLPYVYLTLLDYGQLSVDVANVGWIAQHEVLFLVALQWFRRINGRLVFYDWATVTPFIYVDDPLSLGTGRLVYGWPKQLADIAASLSDWVQNPKTPISEIAVRGSVFQALYSGAALTDQVLLTIEHDRPPDPFCLPFDPKSALNPWTIGENIATTLTGFARDAANLIMGFGVAPMNPASSGDNYLSMFETTARGVFPLNPNLLANTLNLKQFRLSEDPTKYCYQALTNAPIRYNVPRAAGMLGVPQTVLGDPSGGFNIKLYDFPTLPIVETLGLEVESRISRPGDVDVLTLKPVLPFWWSGDMQYLTGTNVAWRARDTTWHDADGRTYPPNPWNNEQPLFNTTLGAGNETVVGPFHFFGMTIRVLPLLVDEKQIKAFLDEYLNSQLKGAERQFCYRNDYDTVGPHVYLVATSVEHVRSETNNIGDWMKVDAGFLIPVTCTSTSNDCNHVRDDDPKGYLPVFNFVDNVTAAAARTEVLGIPTILGQFDLPDASPNPWMAKNGPDPSERRMLFQVQAEILPAVGEGQKAVMETIVEIHQVQPDHPVQSDPCAPCAPPASPQPWGQLGTNALSLFSFKQFRDVSDPDHACYQSLVDTEWQLAKTQPLTSFQAPMRVKIFDFPSLPIVSTLGIQYDRRVSHGTGIAYEITPVDPFWFTADVDEALGTPLGFRAGGFTWETL